MKRGVALEIIKGLPEVPQAQGKVAQFGTDNLPLIAGRWGCMLRADQLHIQATRVARHWLPQWSWTEVSCFLTALLCCLLSFKYTVSSQL